MALVRAKPLVGAIDPQARSTPQLGLGISIADEKQQTRLVTAREDGDGFRFCGTGHVVQLSIRVVRSFSIAGAVLHRRRRQNHDATIEALEDGLPPGIDEVPWGVVWIWAVHAGQASHHTLRPSPHEMEAKPGL